MSSGRQARACNLSEMARPATDKASLSVESVFGKASVPSNVSGEGSFSLDCSAFGKASVAHEGSVPGEGPFSLDGSVPRKASIALENPVPGEASVTLKGAVHDKGFVGIDRAIRKASVRVKDTGGFGTGSFSCEGSVPAPLDGCILVRGEDSNKGHGPSCIRKDDGKVSVPVDQGVIRSLECPILTRFRLRRLLSFLESTRFYDAYVAMQSKVSVVLDLKYLQRHLELCLWDDARNYLLRILPYSHMGVDGRTLMDFLSYLMFMHAIATRHQMAPEFMAKFECSCRDPAVLRDGNQATIMRTILSMRSQQVKPSVNWSVVGKKAAEIVRDFITHAPEFSEYLRLPRRSSNIHNVVNVFPCGFRSHRRIVKKAARVPGSVIAKYFLSKARLQPGGQRMGCSGLVTDPSAWLKAAIDETLQTGMCATLYQAHPIGYAYNKGMDRKRLRSSVIQDLDAGNSPKRSRKAEIRMPSGDKQTRI